MARFSSSCSDSDVLFHVVRGSPDPAPSATEGLPTRRVRGDPRSALTAGSGDPRRTPLTSESHSAVTRMEASMSNDTHSPAMSEALELVHGMPQPIFQIATGGIAGDRCVCRLIGVEHGHVAFIASAFDGRYRSVRWISKSIHRRNRTTPKMLRDRIDRVGASSAKSSRIPTWVQL